MENPFEWPFFALDDDIRPALKKAVDNGETCVLATLVNIDGSSPRPLGSQMLVTEKGRLSGYVSGGCVESNIAEFGKEALKTGEGHFVPFGLGSPFFDVKLVCGKRIDNAIDVLKPDDEATRTLLRLTGERTEAFWVGDISDNAHYCIAATDKAALDRILMKLDKESRDYIAQAFENGTRAGIIGEVYFKRYMPPYRLIINSANPVALALTRIAENSDFEIIYNRRHGPDKPQNIALPVYERLAAEKLFEKYPADSRTAVVTLAHNQEEDNSFIAPALIGQAFYVGVLGSKKHLPSRHRKLKDMGVPEQRLSDLSAPVGLDIGAATANEIALCIMAEIIRKRRLGNLV